LRWHLAQSEAKSATLLDFLGFRLFAPARIFGLTAVSRSCREETVMLL
jgi:hypothetical protein